VTERQWHPDDTDDTATQQLPRVQPPLPGSLNPVRRPAADPAPETAEAQSAAQPPADATAELSIDDLMGPSRPVQTARPVAVPPPPAPSSAAPVTSAAPAGPSVVDRMRGDAAAAWSAGLTRSRTWLDRGDNAVIAATAVVALLLLVMIAVL
jgi:hypothetical protein